MEVKKNISRLAIGVGTLLACGRIAMNNLAETWWPWIGVVVCAGVFIVVNLLIYSEERTKKRKEADKERREDEEHERQREEAVCDGCASSVPKDELVLIAKGAVWCTRCRAGVNTDGLPDAPALPDAELPPDKGDEP